MKQRIFSLFLTLAVVLGMVPAVAAADTPTLGFKDTYLENGVLMEDSDFMSAPEREFPFTHRVSFYYGTESSHAVLTDITDVSVGDPSVLTITERSTSDAGEQIFRIIPHKLGSTTITVTGSFGSYTMPITFTLPDLGAYTQPIADEQYLISDPFAYSADNDTFYFVLNDSTLSFTEMFLDDPDYDYSGNFDLTLAADGSYVTVKIVDTTNLDGASPRFYCRVSNSIGSISGRGTNYVEFVDGTESIGYVDIWYDNDQLTYDDQFYKQLDLDMGSSTRIAFAYGNASDYDLLTDVINVTSEDEDIATVELRDEDGSTKIWRVNSTGLGSTILTVETDSSTYRMPINVEMPTLGCYTQPDRQSQYLITDGFEFTAANNTFYLILDHDDLTIADAWVEDSGFDSNFLITTTSGSKIATVEIIDTTDLDDSWLNFRVQLGDANGSTNDLGTWGTGLRLLDGTPITGIKYTWTDNGVLVEDGDFESLLTLQYSFSNRVSFYHGTSRSNQIITGITDITAADPDILSVALAATTDAGEQLYRLTGKALGNTTLTFTADSGTYTMPVEVIYPYMGIYTEPVRDLDYFVENEFAYTAANNIFYFFTNDPDIQLTECYVRNSDFTDNFDITIASDGSYAKVEIIDFTGLAGECPNFRCSGIDPNTGRSRSFGSGYVTFVSGDPAPGIKFARWENNTLDTWSDFMTTFSDGFGSNPAVVFYYGTTASHTALTDIASVTVADPDMAEVNYWADTVNGEPCYDVNFLKPGSTEIIVELEDGTTYRIPLSMNLYNVWAFSTDSFDADYAIKSFALTVTQDTFYFVARSGFRLTKLEIEQEFAGAFTVTQPSDCVYAVQVTAPSQLPDWNDYYIQFYMEGADSNGTFRENVYLPVRNEIPAAGIRFAWYENDIMDARGDFLTDIALRIGSSPFVPCYGTQSSNEPMENIVSITSEDPSLFTVCQQGTAASGGTVWAVEVSNSYASGTANMVITTADGTVYKIPVTVVPPMAAVYDSASDDSGSYSFTFTDTQLEFYVKPVDPTHTICGIGVEWPDGISVELAPDNSFAIVRLDDPAKFSFGRLLVKTHIETLAGTEYSSFWVDTDNTISPSAALTSSIIPTQHPTWTDQSGAGVSSPEQAQELTVSVPVTNTDLSADIEISAMLAIYNEAGRMLALRTATLTLAPDSSEVVSISVDLDGLNDPHHAKLFMVDGSYTPISTVFELN